MIKIIFVLLNVLMIGCSTVTPSPKLEAYKKRFVEEYELRTGKQISKEFNNIKIGFVSSFLADDTLGVCYYYDNHIEISRKQWDNYLVNDMVREYIIFHELGHCFLDRGHTKSFSIMQPYLMPMRMYDKYRDELLDELFKGK